MLKTNSPLIATLVFTFLAFLLPALNFLLLPLYLQYLLPEEYGVLHLMNNVSALVMSIGALRINASVLTHYFDFTYNPERLKTYLGNILSFSFVLGLAFFILSAITGSFIFDLVFKSSSIPFYPYGILAVGIGLLWNFASPYFIFIKNEKAIFRYAWMYVLLVILNVGLQYFFIVITRTGVTGILWGKLISNGAMFFIVLYLSRDILFRKWNKYYLYRALQFSIPLLPFLLVNWFQVSGDRFVLERFLDLKSVGIYSLLITLVGLLPTLLNAVMSGIRPFLFEHYGNGVIKNKNKINELYQFFILSAVIGASGVVLLGTNIHYFTDNKDYLTILPYVTIIAVVFFIRCYLLLFSENLLYRKESKKISLLSILLAIVLLTGYLVLVPLYGIPGIIYAHLASNLVVASAFYFTAQKVFPVPFPLMKMLMLPVFIVGSILLGQCMVETGWMSYSLMGILQFIGVVSMILLFYFKTIKKIMKPLKEPLKNILIKIQDVQGKYPIPVLLSPLLLVYFFILYLKFTPGFFNDEMRYWGYALYMLEGQYAMPTDTFLWNGPGIPIILLPFAAFDLPVWTPRLMNAFFVFGGICFFYKTAILYLSKLKSLLLTICLGLYFPFLWTVFSYYYSEPLCFFLVAFASYQFIRLIQNPLLGKKRLIYGGVPLGYLALTKVIFGYVLAVAFFIGFISWLLEKRLIYKKGVLMVGLAILFCLPYLSYTYKKTGKIFYWGNAGGMQLYWMSSPYENELGDWHPLPGNWNPFPSSSDLTFFGGGRQFYKKNHLEIANILVALPPVKRDEYLKQKALDNIKKHPLKYMSNWCNNIGRLFFGIPFSQRPFSWKTLVLYSPNFLLLALMLISGWKYIFRFQKMPSELNGIFLFTVAYLGASSLLSAYPRFLFVVLPILFLWVGIMSSISPKNQIY